MRIAVYPGSFDPFTNGHLDIARRAARLFDRLIVGVYEYPEKDVLFSAEERVEMVRLAVVPLGNVDAEVYSGLTVEYAVSRNATTIVRGLRAISDFEIEYQLAHMNSNLNPAIEATFLMTSLPYAFLSSSIVREIAKLGGSLNGLVPEHVAVALVKKYDARQRAGELPTSGLVT